MSDADEFRAGLADGRLVVRVCSACHRAAYPPMPGCASCGHDGGELVESSGRGTLYSWTVCHVAFDPAFADDVPYAVGLVEIPEKARIVARIRGDLDELRAEMPMTVRFDAQPDGATMLSFEPAKDGQP